jgi:hypothetical protein
MIDPEINAWTEQGEKLSPIPLKRLGVARDLTAHCFGLYRQLQLSPTSLPVDGGFSAYAGCKLTSYC